MFGYIYKTTNLINNKIYIGQHHSSIFDNKYFGSGKLLREAIKKYGKENFSCELLEEIDIADQLLLNEKEVFWIKKLNSQNLEIGYNLARGGWCSEDFETTLDKISKERKKHSSWIKGKHMNDEYKNKIRKSLMGHKHKEESKIKMSISHTGMRKSGMYGKKHSEKTKELLRIKNKNYKPTEEIKKKISLSMKKYRQNLKLNKENSKNEKTD